MPENSSSILNPATEPEVGYGQLFGVLVRRRGWLMSGLLLGLALGGVAALLQKPTFTSALQLLVEPNYSSKNASDAKDEFADVQVQVDMATQLQLLQSTKLIQRAMQLLQEQFPDIDPDDPRSVKSFKNALKVERVVASDTKDNAETTKIFQIAYVSNDPEKAKTVVEALQQVYQDFNLEQQRERLTRGLEFVNKQLPETFDKVQTAERKLGQFRSDQEMLNPEIQGEALETAVNRIIQEQQTTRTQLQRIQTQYDNLQQQIGMSPTQALLASRLAQSSRYQTLLNEIQKTELAIAEQKLRFQPGTPEMDLVEDARQQQVSMLRTEAGRVVGQVANGGELLQAGQLGGLDLNLITQFVNTQIELQGVLAQYRNLLNEEQSIREELKRFPKLLEVYNNLLPDIELNRDALKQLMVAQQEIGLEIARGGYDWQVVEEPQVGLRQAPGLVRFLLLGTVAGLMVGGMIAFAREAIDDAIHSSEDLQKQVTLPLLGMVPELKVSPNTLQMPFSKSAALTADTSMIMDWQPFRDAIDLLYQNMQMLHPDGVLKSLVVTSALAGEGKSTLSLAIAMSAARLNKRVLLIDADLRRPSLHKLLNLPNAQGLSSFLQSDIPIPELANAQTASARSNLAVITAGPSPADPAKLLSSNRMKELIKSFESHYDLVMVDAPPVIGMVDAVLASACTTGTLLVGRLDRVTRSELTQAMSILRPLNMIGVVANGADAPMLDSSYDSSDDVLVAD